MSDIIPSTNSRAWVLADFMFAARIQNALTQLGWDNTLMASPEALLKPMDGPLPSLLLLELGANPSRIDLIRSLRAETLLSSLPILAFGSHKLKGMLKEARDAGATLVVSNGTLVSRFPEVLQQAMKGNLTEEERLQTEDD